MRYTVRRVVLATLVGFFGTAPDAHAVCNQTGANTADNSLFTLHGCWQDFFLWQYRAYDMKEDDWGDRGWSDACNIDFEYTKHWNAAYLVTYGLADDNGFSFHGTTDYRQLGEFPTNDYHDWLRHVASDASGFGSFTPTVFGPNLLATHCPLYDPGATSPNSNPGSRAGDFMHEGWHGWLDKYDWDNGDFGGHRAAQGNCTAANFCDYFYFHGIGDFAFGELWKTDGTAEFFHSPNQIQVEFLCDVADFPQPWIPASVRQSAAADANTRAAQRFINGPGYTCGSPRPW